MTTERQPEFNRFLQWYKAQYGRYPAGGMYNISSYKNLPEYKFWVSVNRPATKVTADTVRKIPGVEKRLAELQRSEAQPIMRLPPQLTINGQTVNVQWTSLGSVIDENGEEVEYYMPVFPQNDYPDELLPFITQNIYAFNKTSEEFTKPTTQEILKNTGLDDKKIANIARFEKLSPQLQQMGMPKDFLDFPGIPSEVNIWGMNRLKNLASKDPAIFEQLGYIQKQPNLMDRIISAGVKGGGGTPLSQLVGGIPSERGFTSELDYQQAIQAYLAASGQDTGADYYQRELEQGREALKTQAGQRITELQAGGAPSFSLESRENDEAAREAELQASKLLKWSETDAQGNVIQKTGTELPKGETEEHRRWRQLVEQSRRPQRVARI